MSVAKGFRLSDNSTAKLDWNYVTKPDGTKSIMEEVNDVKQDLNIIGGQPSYEISWTEGGYIKDSDGTVGSSSGWKYTNFVELSTNILLVTFDGNEGDKYNAIYDANQNFIQNLWINGGYDRTEITLPINAKYVRMSCKSARTLTIDYPKISVTNLKSELDTAESRITANENNIESNKSDIDTLNGFPMQFDINWIEGGYINGSTGALISYTGWKYTDYIELYNTNDFYVSTDSGRGNSYNAFYDENKEYIRGLYITQYSDKAVIDYVPANAKYVRLSIGSTEHITMEPDITSVQDINERVLALENGQMQPLPAYYDDYMLTKNASVNSKMDAIANCVSFIFFTDPHMSENKYHSGSMMANIRRNTSVKDVICGGDVISAYGNEASMVTDCETYKKYWGELEPYFTRGNHDIYAKVQENTNVGYIEPNSMVINRFIRPFHNDMVIPQGKTYYYVDKPNNKMRFIFVDTNENITGVVADNVWNPSYAISQTQIDWFISLLMQTPMDYKIVLFNHIPINSNLRWGSGFAYIFGDIVEAFNGKTTINKTDSYGITASADFTNASGEIILSICGHGHTDDVYTSATGCVYYEVNCDSLINNGGSQYTRTAGTISEQAFDVIIIDADSGNIEAVRYGAGEDKTLIQH